MSGSSGGGWDDAPERIPPKTNPVGGGGDGSGGGAGGQPDACLFEEVTLLNSVDPTVLATLRVGELLDVEYQAGPPQRLIARKPGGAIAGSITSPSMLRFIQCIMQGHQYTAEVLVQKGGICQVRVHRK